jgi:hypothetical protein
VGQVDKANLVKGYILLPDASWDLGNAFIGNFSGLYDGE